MAFRKQQNSCLPSNPEQNYSSIPLVLWGARVNFQYARDPVFCSCSVVVNMSSISLLPWEGGFPGFSPKAARAGPETRERISSVKRGFPRQRFSHEQEGTIA